MDNSCCQCGTSLDCSVCDKIPEISHIRFFDRATGRGAVLSSDGIEFVVKEDGSVGEFVEQLYANFTAVLERENLRFEIVFK